MFFYFLAPYINKLIYGLNIDEIRLLYWGSVVILFWMQISLYLYSNYDVGNALLVQYINSGGRWFLECILLFLTGYYVSVEKVNITWWIKWLGIIGGFVLYCFDIQFMQYVILFFLSCKSDIIIHNETFNRVLLFIDKQSYSVYLIHAAVISVMLKVTAFINFIPVRLFLCYIFTFIVSLIVSYFIDYVITNRIIVLVKKSCKMV